MSQNTSTEERFLEYLAKKADSESVDLYPGPESEIPKVVEPITFSDAAQAENKLVREGVPDRLLPNKAKSDAAERAIVSAIFNTRDFETSSIQLKPVEKVSHLTLAEQVVRKFGRL